MAQQKVALGVLTTASTAILEGVSLTAAQAKVALSFDFDRDGVIYRGGVAFSGVRAYRVRAESHCTAWHIDGVYDTVVEIKDSEWVAELTQAQQPDQRGYFMMCHFMLYIDSAGCFEVVGSSWSLMVDRISG